MVLIESSIKQFMFDRRSSSPDAGVATVGAPEGDTNAAQVVIPRASFCSVVVVVVRERL